MHGKCWWELIGDQWRGRGTRGGGGASRVVPPHLRIATLATSAAQVPPSPALVPGFTVKLTLTFTDLVPATAALRMTNMHFRLAPAANLAAFSGVAAKQSLTGYSMIACCMLKCGVRRSIILARPVRAREWLWRWFNPGFDPLQAPTLSTQVCQASSGTFCQGRALSASGGGQALIMHPASALQASWYMGLSAHLGNEGAIIGGIGAQLAKAIATCWRRRLGTLWHHAGDGNHRGSESNTNLCSERRWQGEGGTEERVCWGWRGAACFVSQQRNCQWHTRAMPVAQRVSCTQAWARGMRHRCKKITPTSFLVGFVNVTVPAQPGLGGHGGGGGWCNPGRDTHCGPSRGARQLHVH